MRAVANSMGVWKLRLKDLPAEYQQMKKRSQARLRLAERFGGTVIDGGLEPHFDVCSDISAMAASPLGTSVLPLSMSLTEDGANPTNSPISASVSPVDLRSEMRDAQVVTRSSLRYPITLLQRHSVTVFREGSGMPKPPDLPSFDTLGARIAYWRKRRAWDRRELAKRAKIPYSTLAGIEDEDQKTSTKIPQIAAALGLNPIYLATDKGDPETLGAPSPIDEKDSWPLPFSREELLELDPIELELAGLKFQRIIEEIRAKRPKQRQRKQG